MDLEVVGRHALLFDDDANASFVNSPEALVEWNSLKIDRYDVRHLLSSPPPPRKRRLPSQSTDDVLESELDSQRYFDLPQSSPSPSDQQDRDTGEGPVSAGGFHAVHFSYGNTGESSQLKDVDAKSGFHPPIPVPESLLQNLPPTEKVHQIIARTAMFVSKHGGQSEIVLRVKQGDNPTFGFLMPDHPLHPYFRFLVDHHELLSSRSLEEENKTDGGTGGALSLLGSVYGSGEDEEGATEGAQETRRNESPVTGAAANKMVLDVSAEKGSSMTSDTKDEVVTKHSTSPLREKPSFIKRNRPISTIKAGTTTRVKKENDVSAADKASISTLPKLELPVVEPPSDLKRVVDKIVEFILRNGKQFEAVLVEQDVRHGRFPFLLQSNIYHSYYLKVLQRAEESKLPGRGVMTERHDSSSTGSEKKAALPKVMESDTVSTGSDIPYDSDRKEKFKMVISKSKKDGQDQSPKATQLEIGVKVDAAAAAAILQAATRGIRNPNLDILSKTSVNGSSQGPSRKNGPPNIIGEASISAPVAHAIAKTAAIAAAGEADSSEAHLTKEQKVKAERLKRAKMFAAMIKSGAEPMKGELVRGLSAEPSESGISRSGGEAVNLLGKEREGSSAPIEVDTSDENGKSEKKLSGGDPNEHRSKRKYRSRSKRHEDSQEEGEEREGKEGKEKERGRDHKHSQRNSRTHHSSHRSKDRHKHVKDHSYRKHRESQHRHDHYIRSDDDSAVKSDSSSDYKHYDSSHRSRCDRLSGAERRHSRRRHRHDSSSGDERQNTLHRHKHYSSDEGQKQSRRHRRNGSSSDDEYQHRRKRSHLEREAELEEGEICTKSDQSKAGEGDGASREASVDISKSYPEGRAPSLLSDTTNVPDDLRAKIRAMLMATL